MSSEPRVEAEIEMVSVDRVKPHPENPRNNDHAVDALVKAIRKYGFNQPIVVDREGMIVKGHARYDAARMLGMSEVPVIRTDATPKQASADRVLDNKIHDLSKWDNDALVLEMRDVEDAVSRVLEEFGTEPYSHYESKDVTEEDVDEAEDRMKNGAYKEPTLVKVVCACGEEMYLSRDAVEGLS